LGGADLREAQRYHTGVLGLRDLILGRREVDSAVVVVEPPRASEILKLGYDSALSGLSRQDALLGSTRNRATALLSASTVGTAFAASVGLINNDPAKGIVLRGWAAISLLVVVVVIGILVLVIVWPIKWYHFPEPTVYLNQYERGRSLERFYTYAIKNLQEAIAVNNKVLRRLANILSAAIILVTVQLMLIVVVFALLRNGAVR
jgi:hypothetical protein